MGLAVTFLLEAPRPSRLVEQAHDEDGSERRGRAPQQDAALHPVEGDTNMRRGHHRSVLGPPAVAATSLEWAEAA